ncbi:MAG: TRAM domain-containing protein [Actinobacteria bacterium]|uniref:Unannotated protein n=1 Tax=freshwater metagenome TaxID=449393 RepID=A0A6J6P6S7_9ZZZZ|nr:TRAM domain-containing protein [Actinomycetota bacterium]MSY11573.1 TRAM domain-containing protein [Actinomycetota bacterium]MSZ04775.1 TRAM domain-containing protein [Actinomycetota bacterium]MTB06665.1 TRAM domain-containing protein [Actinomycetota bacterium]
MVMELELAVERLAVGGNGIAREPDGRVVFVEGALPGETVRAEIVSRGKDFWRARTLEVVEAAATRVAPPCPHVRAGCGGCGWQYVATGAQPTLKAAMVRDALARQGRLADAVVTVGSGVDGFGYRTTLRAGVAPDGRLGLRRQASHEIVRLSDCPVAHPALSALLGTLRAPGADGVVMRVSEASGERTLLVVPGAATTRLEGVPADVKVGADAFLFEVVDGQRLRVSAGSFFQSSARSAELLVDAVRRAAGDTSGMASWADLYSGIGLFAATLFGDVAVVAVELSASSVADAQLNLADRQAAMIEGDVETWTPAPVDLVVADPSRSGLGRGGVGAVTGTGAGTVVLVSCDAAALARDTALLAAAGYRHAGSEVLDLFPQTPHVEVVTRFERIGG